MEEEEDSQRLWVIVRYMTVDGRTNEYKLRQSQFQERNGERKLLAMGETIKMGRVKFRVREISIEPEGAKPSYIQRAAEDDSKTDFNSNEDDNNEEESKEYQPFGDIIRAN